MHQDFDAFIERCHLPSTTFFTKLAPRSYTSIRYPTNAVLVFGQETKGLGNTRLKRFSDRLARIPITDKVRSLNLSNSVAIALYEVIRQQGEAYWSSLKTRHVESSDEHGQS